MNKVEKDIVRRAATAYLKAEEPEELAEFETVFDVAFRVLDEPRDTAPDAAWAHGRLQADSSFVEMTPSAAVIWMTTQLVRALTRIGEGRDFEVELAVLAERIADYTGQPNRADGIANELRALRAEIRELREMVSRMAARAGAVPGSAVPIVGVQRKPSERAQGVPQEGLRNRVPLPADLEIQVDVAIVDGHQHLRYTLDSPNGKVSCTRRKILGPLFEMKPKEFQEDLFKGLENLHGRVVSNGSTILREEILPELEKLGRELYDDLFTLEMKDFYRKFRDDIETLHIISYESWIPWELLKPYDDRDPEAVIDEEFWGLRFQLTRWLTGDTVPPMSIVVPRLAVIEAGSPPEMKPLAHAREELALLEELARRQGVEDGSLSSSTFERVERKLGEEDLGLIHFVGHGQLMLGQPNQASFLLEDGRSWRPRDLRGSIGTRLRRNRPLVFVNACQMGQPGWARTRLGGWAPSWIESGCGAFLGPQWTIDDDLAFAFAKAFYAELERGATLGAAATTARRSLGGVAMAYAIYGHPEGKLELGRQRAQGSH